jgi:hypothetical protein
MNETQGDWIIIILIGVIVELFAVIWCLGDILAALEKKP